MAAVNAALQAAIAHYDAVCDDYVRSLKDKGIDFAERGAGDDVIARLRDELVSRGVAFRNDGASLSVGWLSEACVECTGNRGSKTFSTTLACHRDCYFCFNHNLENYDVFFKQGCPWREELAQAKQEYGTLACVALTGGEPLLAFDDALAFLHDAGQMFPDAHMRMYTSGDLLTVERAQALAQAGLDEIRFSVKIEDDGALQQRVLDNMAMATRFIRDVMVEMPVIPSTEEKMKQLLRDFDAAGVKGINLLEFCFPFHDWPAFSSRGFQVRNPPFPVMYDYLYSGGLAIAGSEELCLKLMLFGLDEGLKLGMHYCSLENKHRSEMRQRNEPARDVHPCIEFDEGDFFLKTIKVYGEDRALVRALLESAGCTHFVEDDEEKSLAFPPKYVKNIAGAPVQPALSYNAIESDDEGGYLRELLVQSI